MSEIIPLERNENSEPQESETLIAARKFLAFTEDVRDFEASRAPFLTRKAAEEAQKLSLSRYIELANNISGVETLNLTLGGEGVSVPNMKMTSFDTGSEELPGVAVYVDPEEPMKKLSIAEDIAGRFEGISVDIKEEEGVFRIQTSLIVQIGEFNQSVINPYPAAPLPFVTITASRRGLVSLDGSAEISADVLELERQAKESRKLARQYENLPYVNGAFGKHLNRLESALREEDETSFTQLKNPRIIRSLGRTGAKSANHSQRAATVIEDSLLHRIGQNRQLQIVYSETNETDNAQVETVRKYVSGRLLHVAVQGMEGENIPKFVLDGTSGVLNGYAEYGIHYVPFTQVEQFSF